MCRYIRWLVIVTGLCFPVIPAYAQATSRPAAVTITSQAKQDQSDTQAKPNQPKKRSPAKNAKDKSKRDKDLLWNRDLGLGGYAGTWGGMPLIGLRGAIPVSPYLAIRLGFSLFFATQRQPVISYTNISLAFLVRLPSLLPPIRSYAVTRLDFWPLWNVLNTNPEITKISEKPTFGLSVLVGMELFLVRSLAFVLEAGFSSGMIFGFSKIKTQFEAFGFVMQSGLQMYF